MSEEQETMRRIAMFFGLIEKALTSVLAAVLLVVISGGIVLLSGLAASTLTMYLTELVWFFGLVGFFFSAIAHDAYFRSSYDITARGTMYLYAAIMVSYLMMVTSSIVVDTPLVPGSPGDYLINTTILNIYVSDGVALVVITFVLYSVIYSSNKVVNSTIEASGDDS